MSDSDITRTELFRYMMQSGRYSREDAIEVIEEMRNDVANGDNPEEVLHEEGIEPDFVFDLLP